MNASLAALPDIMQFIEDDLPYLYPRNAAAF